MLGQILAYVDFIQRFTGNDVFRVSPENIFKDYNFGIPDSVNVTTHMNSCFIPSKICNLPLINLLLQGQTHFDALLWQQLTSLSHQAKWILRTQESLQNMRYILVIFLKLV